MSSSVDRTDPASTEMIIVMVYEIVLTALMKLAAVSVPLKRHLSTTLHAKLKF